MKKGKNLVFGLFLMSALCFGLFYGGNYKTANAATNSKEIQKKITTLKKEIKELQKKRAVEKKKEKKQAKGTTPIMGEIISTNPYIVYQSLFEEAYYWVENSKYMRYFLGQGTGDVKLTGKYRNYNGITCAVCKAVKVGNKSLKYETIIEKKEKELSNCKNSLKEKVVLSKTKIKINQKKKIKYKWKYSGKYNTIKWKSSNTDIATIDNNGYITGYKQGEVTITATCSLSGEKTQCIVDIWDDFHVYADNYEESIDDNYDYIQCNQKSIKFTYKFSNPETKDTVTYNCDTSVASITQDGVLTFKYPETVDVEVKSSYKSVTFSVECTAPEVILQDWYDYFKVYYEQSDGKWTEIENDKETIHIDKDTFKFKPEAYVPGENECRDLNFECVCLNDYASVHKDDSGEYIVNFRRNGEVEVNIYWNEDYLYTIHINCDGVVKDEDNNDDNYYDGY